MCERDVNESSKVASEDDCTPERRERSVRYDHRRQAQSGPACMYSPNVIRHWFSHQILDSCFSSAKIGATTSPTS